MIVNFYKTKLGAQNRCYDKGSYINYFAKLSLEQKFLPFEMKNNVVPNNVFYVPRTNTTSGVTTAYQWEDYNYITFEYEYPITEVGGVKKHVVKYGAFITKVQQISVDGTVAIYHTTDNWYYLLMNDIDFGLHGQMIQGHVNDLKPYYVSEKINTYTPTLKNTLIKPEFNCSSNGFESEVKYVPPYDGNKPTNVHYIYVLINDPYQKGFAYVGDIKLILQEVNYGYKDETLTSNQLLLVGAFREDGTCTFCVSKDILSDGYPFTITMNGKPYTYITNIADLKSDSITQIMVSDIAPNDNTFIRQALDDKGKKVAYLYYTGDKEISSGFTSDLAGLPSFFNVVPNISYMSNSLSLTDYLLNSDIYCSSTDLGTHLYNEYYTYYNYGLIKLRSSPYNVVTYCGEQIDYSMVGYGEAPTHGTNITINMGCDFSLNYFYFKIVGLNTIDEKTSFTYINNTCSFAPITTKSYFDKYDLSIASSNAITSYIKLGFNFIKSGTNIFSSLFGSDTKDISNNTTEFAENLAITPYKISKISNTYDKTVGQIENGKISSVSPFGYYSSIGKIDIESLYFTRLNEVGYAQLAPLVHRYGYNTPLQIDEVYKNHQRAFFNYMQGESVELEGVTSTVANDLENMFESGVHLWTITYRKKVGSETEREFVGDVGKWEQPNWQIDVYNTIRNGGI